MSGADKWPPEPGSGESQHPWHGLPYPGEHQAENTNFHCQQGLWRSARSSPRVSYREGEAQKGPAPSHRAAEGTAGTGTRAAAVLALLTLLCGMGRLLSWPCWPIAQLFPHSPKATQGASSPLKVGPRGPLKLPQGTPALPPSHSRQALSATHRLWSQQDVAFSDRLRSVPSCLLPLCSQPSSTGLNSV